MLKQLIDQASYDTGDPDFSEYRSVPYTCSDVSADNSLVGYECRNDEAKRVDCRRDEGSDGICVPKCCGRGQVYDIQETACVEGPGAYDKWPLGYYSSGQLRNVCLSLGLLIESIYISRVKLCGGELTYVWVGKVIYVDFTPNVFLKRQSKEKLHWRYSMECVHHFLFDVR